MKAITNALKGVSYHNPQLGESLYELCRRATSRHIAGPDEILNQQVVYVINSEMHTPYAAKDAATCLKRRLQMDHPQKQYLAVILTSKVLQECHAAIGIYQGELLQEVAYILRTQRSSGPAAARTRQVAMDVLRHYGSAGGDAYRYARQAASGGMPGAVAGGPPRPEASMGSVARDPAAIAAERASLLDEIKRMVEQAGASTEILNELILNKEQGGAAGAAAAESAGLRRELLADARELRKLFDNYMEQLAGLSGPDAEEAMKAALEAVDQLDNALSLEHDVDAELKDAQKHGQPLAPPALPASAAGASSSAAPAAGAAAAAAASRLQSVNLIDLDDDQPAVPAGAAPAAAAAPADPFAPAATARAAVPADPFAPAAAAAQAPADPFAPAPVGAASDPYAPVGAAAADPFATLAAAPVAATQPYPAAPQELFPPAAPFAAPAAAAYPFSDALPAWGAPGAGTQVPGSSSGGGSGFDALPPASMPLQQAPAAAASQGFASGAFGNAPAAPAYGAAPAAPGYGPPPPGYGAPMPGFGAAGYGGAPPGGGYPLYNAPPAGAAYSAGPYPAAPLAAAAYPSAMQLQPAPLQAPQPAQQLNVQQQQQPQQLLQPQAPPPQQQLQQTGSFGAPPPQPAAPAPSTAGFGATDSANGGGVLSPSNPFASVAPASGGGSNPFQTAAAASGGGANTEQEWNAFFSDSRPK